MLTNLLLPRLTWLDLDEICTDEQQITFMLTSTQCAACPQCNQPSLATHSQYQRRIADLPCAGMTVCLHGRVRKFFCRNPACQQVVFSERLSSLAAAYARRTQRLSQEQQRLGLDLGGEVGARTAQRQGMPVSADTVSRLVRQAALPELSMTGSYASQIFPVGCGNSGDLTPWRRYPAASLRCKWSTSAMVNSPTSPASTSAAPGCSPASPPPCRPPTHAAPS